MATGHRAVVKFYSLKRYATDKSKTGNDGAASPPSSSAAAVDKCAATPTICGHGKCISVQTGYTCRCDPGFKLSALQTNCIGKTSAALVVIKASGSPASQSEKGSVCLRRPARRCLTIAPGPSKELPLCCDPLPWSKACWQESQLLPQFGVFPIDFLAFLRSSKTMDGFLLMKSGSLIALLTSLLFLLPPPCTYAFISHEIVLIESGIGKHTSRKRIDWKSFPYVTKMFLRRLQDAVTGKIHVFAT